MSHHNSRYRRVAQCLVLMSGLWIVAECRAADGRELAVHDYARFKQQASTALHERGFEFARTLDEGIRLCERGHLPEYKSHLQCLLHMALSSWQAGIIPEARVCAEAFVSVHESISDEQRSDFNRRAYNRSVTHNCIDQMRYVAGAAAAADGDRQAAASHWSKLWIAWTLRKNHSSRNTLYSHLRYAWDDERLKAVGFETRGLYEQFQDGRPFEPPVGTGALAAEFKPLIRQLASAGPLDRTLQPGNAFLSARSNNANAKQIAGLMRREAAILEIWSLWGVRPEAERRQKAEELAVLWLQLNGETIEQLADIPLDRRLDVLVSARPLFKAADVLPCYAKYLAPLLDTTSSPLEALLMLEQMPLSDADFMDAVDRLKRYLPEDGRDVPATICRRLGLLFAAHRREAEARTWLRNMQSSHRPAKWQPGTSRAILNMLADLPSVRQEIGPRYVEFMRDIGAIEQIDGVHMMELAERLQTAGDPAAAGAIARCVSYHGISRCSRGVSQLHDGLVHSLRVLTVEAACLLDAGRTNDAQAAFLPVIATGTLNGHAATAKSDTENPLTRRTTLFPISQWSNIYVYLGDRITVLDPPGESLAERYRQAYAAGALPPEWTPAADSKQPVGPDFLVKRRYGEAKEVASALKRSYHRFLEGHAITPPPFRKEAQTGEASGEATKGSLSDGDSRKPTRIAVSLDLQVPSDPLLQTLRDVLFLMLSNGTEFVPCVRRMPAQTALPPCVPRDSPHVQAQYGLILAHASERVWLRVADLKTAELLSVEVTDAEAPITGQARRLAELARSTLRRAHKRGALPSQAPSHWVTLADSRPTPLRRPSEPWDDTPLLELQRVALSVPKQMRSIAADLHWVGLRESSLVGADYEPLDTGYRLEVGPPVTHDGTYEFKFLQGTQVVSKASSPAAALHAATQLLSQRQVTEPTRVKKPPTWGTLYRQCTRSPGHKEATDYTRYITTQREATAIVHWFNTHPRGYSPKEIAKLRTFRSRSGGSRRELSAVLRAHAALLSWYAPYRPSDSLVREQHTRLLAAGWIQWVDVRPGDAERYHAAFTAAYHTPDRCHMADCPDVAVLKGVLQSCPEWRQQQFRDACRRSPCPGMRHIDTAWPQLIAIYHPDRFEADEYAARISAFLQHPGSFENLFCFDEQSPKARAIARSRDGKYRLTPKMVSAEKRRTRLKRESHYFRKALLPSTDRSKRGHSNALVQRMGHILTAHPEPLTPMLQRWHDDVLRDPTFGPLLLAAMQPEKGDIQRAHDAKEAKDRVTQARAAKIREEWQICLAKATEALAFDIGNHDAHALKREAERHLAPTVTLIPVVDTRPIDATISRAGKTYRPGRPIPVKHEQPYQFDFVYEQDGRCYGLRRFEVTGHQFGPKDVYVTLEAIPPPMPEQPWRADLGDGLSMDFMAVSAGRFVMGSDKSHYATEKPEHHVTLTQPFWLGKTEVTQAQYTQIMKTNPSQSKGSDQPVETVIWHDAIEFCELLTKRERLAGRLPAGYAYTLPTEAQWQFAARGGVRSKGYRWFSGSNNPDDVAWHADNSQRKAHPVGLKQANELGLHDMSGNVWEWCLDGYRKYEGSAVVDPEGPAGGIRVRCGGCWRDSYPDVRVTHRRAQSPQSATFYTLGFRVCFAPSPAATQR